MKKSSGEARPDAVEDEEQLNEDATERQKSTQHDSHGCPDTQQPAGDFPRLQTCPDWMYNCLITQTHTRTRH